MPNSREGDDRLNMHSISLSIEMNVVTLLIEECVAQTARSLRELAERIERGDGKDF